MEYKILSDGKGYPLLSLPKRLMEALGWRPGMAVEWALAPGGRALVLRPVKGDGDEP